jgi:putative ABC transport system permease protein
VTIGVFLTVALSSWMRGIFGDMTTMNANFETGHVKVMTQAYADSKSQVPNDLAILGVDELQASFEQDYPEIEWVSRIHFGALLDVPDEKGETRAQGTMIARAVDLLSPGTKEIERMNLIKALSPDNGSRLPNKQGEILISDDFARRFGVKIGDAVTLFGARIAMDMDDASGEILGYFKSGEYDNDQAKLIQSSFNAKYTKSDNEYSPIMEILTDDPTLGMYLTMSDKIGSIMVFVLIFILSIVLWNTGLLGTIRRYSEFGIRLALGERKLHIYKTMLGEAVVIGALGSILGTALGLWLAYYLQETGIDISAMMKNVTMMIPSVYRAEITTESFYIGFIPGLLAMVLGNALAGRAIFKRQTSQLFKELEV